MAMAEAATVRGADPSLWYPYGDYEVPARRRRFERHELVLVLPALFALGLCCYQLIVAHASGGVYDYDDGVYFGASLRLVSGVTPYRDFVLLHPPGIALLLAPIAGLSHLVGTDVGLTVARALGAVVTAIDVALVAACLRPRGVVVALIGSSAFALFPISVSATNTVLLEPYLVALSLAGLLVCTTGAKTPRRAFVGGVLLGFASLVKLWGGFAIAGVLIALVIVERHELRRVVRYLEGVAIGFALPIAPFVALAPKDFYRDVFVTQISRGVEGASASPISQRVLALTGLRGLGSLNVTAAASEVVLGVGVVLVLSIYGLRWRRLQTFDVAAVVSAIFAASAVLLSRDFFLYYAYFPAAFGALVIGASFSLALGSRSDRLQMARPRGLFVVGATGVALLVAIAIFVADQQVTFSRQYLVASAPSEPAAVIDRAIPKGACVVFDDPAVAIVANRFLATRANCPALVDPYGAWLSAMPGHPPPFAGPFDAQFVTDWLAWLNAADYLVLRAPASDYLPWGPALQSYADHTYTLVGQMPGAYVFRNVTH